MLIIVLIISQCRVHGARVFTRLPHPSFSLSELSYRRIRLTRVIFIITCITNKASARNSTLKRLLAFHTICRMSHSWTCKLIWNVKNTVNVFMRIIRLCHLIRLIRKREMYICLVSFVFSSFGLRLSVMGVTTRIFLFLITIQVTHSTKCIRVVDYTDCFYTFVIY